MDKGKIINTWEEYFEELLCTDNGEDSTSVEWTGKNNISGRIHQYTETKQGDWKN